MTTRRIGWIDRRDDDEHEYTLTVEDVLGYPGSYDEPRESSGVEVLRVIDSSGAPRPELIEVAQASLAQAEGFEDRDPCDYACDTLRES